MGLNLFLLLPEEDAVIENGDIPMLMTTLTNAVKYVGDYVKKNNRAKLYYDSLNLKTFFSTCTTWTNDNKSAVVVRNLFPKTAIDIRTAPKVVNESIYVLWNYDKLPNVNTDPPAIIAEITECKLIYPDHHYLLINICKHLEACRPSLLSIKDAKHLSGMPSPFIHIPFVADKDALDIWVKTNITSPFSLSENPGFVKTTKEVQGKAVFQETSTGYYWYLDNFHKNEYEVFCKNGKHIGVADLQGVIDVTAKVNGRTITL